MPVLDLVASHSFEEESGLVVPIQQEAVLQDLVQEGKRLLVLREEHGDHSLKQFLLACSLLGRVGDLLEQFGVCADDLVHVDLVNVVFDCNVERFSLVIEVRDRLELDVRHRKVVGLESVD